MGVMRDIENLSALLFFLLLHIPLSKISSLYSMVTALIPLLLDTRNKEKFYLTINKVVNWKQTTEILRKNDDFIANQKPKKY